MPIEHRQTLFDFSDDSSIYKEANRQTQVFLGGGIIPAVAKFGLGFVSALVARMCFSVTRWASGSGHSRLHTSEAYSPGHVPTLSWKLILACWCHLQRFASVSKLSAECQSMPRKSVKFTDNVYFYHMFSHLSQDSETMVWTSVPFQVSHGHNRTRWSRSERMYINEQRWI